MMKEYNPLIEEDIILSIIICVYNTDPSYLEECFASIFRSTLNRIRFEVIMIDDGSTIDYSDLLERFAVEYRKIENSGPFAARLHGASCSKGKYLAFLDSDDTVSENYHLPMVQKAQETGADIVINGWAFHTNRTRRICYTDSTMANRIHTETEALPLFMSQKGREHSYFVNWNKIYKREVIEKTVCELEKKGLIGKRLSFAEDVLFNFFNFKNARICCNVSSGFYLYRIHDHQISKEKTRQQLQNHIESMGFVFDTMLQNIGGHPKQDEIQANIHEWRALMARSHYQVALSQKHADLFPLIKKVYQTDILEKPRTEDSAVYEKAELLGENFEEIDHALTECFLSDEPVQIHFEKGCRWITRIAENAARPQDLSDNKGRILSVPKRKIKAGDRIIHNPILYKLGTSLFKKGSSIRAFLKKHL